MRGRTNVGASPILSSITVSQPTQSEYVPGEELNLNGLKVTAYYSSGNTRDVTSIASIAPTSGTVLVEDTVITATYSEGGISKTATCSVTVQFMPEKITWAKGTDKQLKAMLDAHYAGDIDIYDYWHVGDERKVEIQSTNNAPSYGGVSSKQSATLVLVDKKTGDTMHDGTKNYAFVVGHKNAMLEKMVIGFGITTDSFENGQLKDWLNNSYRYSIPSGIRNIIKGIYSPSIFIPSVSQITNEIQQDTYSVYTFVYYRNKSDIIKKLGDDGNVTEWWTRTKSATSGSGSATKYFKYINTGGDVISTEKYNDYHGIVPHFYI